MFDQIIESFAMECWKREKLKYFIREGAPRGGEAPPPETEKIVVEKWCYFPELYKMTKVQEDRIENQ